MVNGKKPTTFREISGNDDYVINPFVSEEQRKACYAANDPNWDCDEWNDKTPSNIPKKKKGTENANPEGINQYTNGAASAAREANSEARSHDKIIKSATVKAGKATKAANELSASATTRIEHEQASQAHKQAAQVHGNAARTQAAAYHRGTEAKHNLAQGFHKQAAEAHISKAVTMNERRSFLQWLGDMWRTDNQGRHPTSGTYQNMPHASARRGFQHTGQADVTGAAATGYDSDDSEDQGDDYEDSTDLETTIKAAVSAGDNGHVGEKTAAELTGEPEGGEVNKKKLGPNRIHNNFFSSPHEASTTALHGSLGKADEARDHALKAHDASKEGSSDKASKFHGKAAEAHEAMATQARKDKEPDQADAHDRSAALHRTAASMHQATTNRKGGTAMGRTYNREEAIQFLTTNCDCWKDKEAVLNEMDDGPIQTLLVTTQVANAKKAGRKVELVFNAEDNNFDMKSVPKPKSLQVGSEGKYKDNFNDNADDEGSSLEEEDGGDGKKVKNAEAGINRWLDDVEAPPEMRAFVENARRQDREARLEIAQRITNNVARQRGWEDEERIEFGEHLMRNKSLDDLREMEMLLPPARNGGSERRPSFVGNGFAPRQPVGNDRGGLRIVDSTEVLEDPGSMTDFVRNENNRDKQTA